MWLSIYRTTHASARLKLMSEGGSGPLRRPNPWLQFNRDGRQDKGPLSLKDAKSDILLGFLLPASVFNVKPHFILIMLVYKTAYFMLPLYNPIVCFEKIIVRIQRVTFMILKGSEKDIEN